MIELSARDYKGFDSAGLDLYVPGRAGKPSGLFDRHVEVFLGIEHVNLTHYEWGIELRGGPKLKAVYLHTRPSFFNRDGFCRAEQHKLLVRFVEKQIRLAVSRDSRSFKKLMASVFSNGKEYGREQVRNQMRNILGVV